MVRVALGPAVGRASSPILLWLAWGWLALMLGTIVALFRRPPWAIPLLVVLIPASTFFLGLSYVPFLAPLVPRSIAFPALLAGNAAALIGSVYVLFRSARAPEAPGGELTRSWS